VDEIMASNKDKIKVGYTVTTQVTMPTNCDVGVNYYVRVMSLTPTITGNWAHRYDEFADIIFSSQGFLLESVEIDVANHAMGVSPIFMPGSMTTAGNSTMTMADWGKVEKCFFQRADNYQVAGKFDKRGPQLLSLVSKALDRYSRWPMSHGDWSKIVANHSPKYIAAAMQLDTFTAFLAGLHSYGARLVQRYDPSQDQGLLVKRGVNTSLDEVLSWQVQSRDEVERKVRKMLTSNK
jgi:hypothetical protein